MPTTELLNTGDYVVIVVYLVGVVAFGSFMARGQETSDDYFLAGQRMHWFPLALSIWASLTSATSMLEGPAYGYSQDLQYVPPLAPADFASTVDQLLDTGRRSSWLMVVRDVIGVR